ncbi:MAG: hypothetical protein CL484_12830 [Acidobacteria bacterium]|nr:hypothetical protein [Acidobacteriota bacterium]
MITKHDNPSGPYAGRHLRFGWWSLWGFLSLGLALELLHGFKVGFYLDVSNETRRFMWTLAHAHGALLGLVHILFAVSLRVFPDIATSSSLRTTSTGLVAASLLLPGGFFAGGVQFYGGDPGLGILLVPIGAVCLAVSVCQIARSLRLLPRPDKGR